MTSLNEPQWQYEAQRKAAEGQGLSEETLPPLYSLDLGTYQREVVSNVESPDPGNQGRAYFDLGLRYMLGYHHEMAARCFLACLQFSPDCALAHGCVALCHSPNYNFKGSPYYGSTFRKEELDLADLECTFPSQLIADRHSRMAVEKVDALRKLHRPHKTSGKKKKGKGRSSSPVAVRQDSNSSSESNPGNSSHVKPNVISEAETQLLLAIRILCCNPGVDFDFSCETVGRPYADAMRKVYQGFPDDVEVGYFFAESLMVLNAWELYEYPTGEALSEDVDETRTVLEKCLESHPHHAGLCHMYVHLSEMSSDPSKALAACESLRTRFPHASHLQHMPTHIDVLVGDYESCVRYNYAAILADEHAMQVTPGTARPQSFFFGYITHNFHMLVYGAILGGMESKAMEVATRLNGLLTEDIFQTNPEITDYLESYSALDIHVLVRFGRWKEILELEHPRNKRLMLYRSASLQYARALAYANTGELALAKKEADRFDTLRKDPSAAVRILHNNTVDVLLAVDAPMVRGEIAYHEGKFNEAFRLLRKAVELQDGLRYDEPWGKMQPIRHALGGLLVKQGHFAEAEDVFRTDLRFHPRNPWALVGLIKCLKVKLGTSRPCCEDELVADATGKGQSELEKLEEQLATQRSVEWADFNVTVPCLCCT